MPNPTTHPDAKIFAKNDRKSDFGTSSDLPTQRESKERAFNPVRQDNRGNLQGRTEDLSHFRLALRRFFGFLLGTEFLYGQDALPSRPNCVPRTNWRAPGEEDLGSAQTRPVDHGVRSTTSLVHPATSSSSGILGSYFANFSNTMGKRESTTFLYIFRTRLCDRST
jgi:hypothetical protein